MIFTPYSDETNVINMIRKYRNEDYALIRMTYTMALSKSFSIGIL